VLCGSCERGFLFSATSGLCANCQNLRTFLPTFIMLALGVVLFLAIFAIYSLRLGESGSGDCAQRTAWFQQVLFRACVLPLWGILKHVDRGMCKQIYVTAQILATISWNIRVVYPEPFASALTLLSFTHFDVSSVRVSWCITSAVHRNAH
jgi:hypothetical protein